ncbi:MAG TPA: type II toxin-antitoxin system antitoxin SocA domain-containing protein [Candidatus Dormibacteraeota bacterium]|nr:type II toxin-antitoxin system antitoxin SocA domain-containing protein [Candidatus Dormibacteraeota bacterium]
MASRAVDIAKYLLFVASRDGKEGSQRAELLTPLKLQKLLYYVQGFHLALLNRPAFEEEERAWTHGPVVREVYDLYKGSRATGIEPPKAPPELPVDTMGVVEEVSEVYGQFSAWRLREMTHETPPWKDARRGSVIAHEAMREYFLTQLAE